MCQKDSSIGSAANGFKHRIRSRSSRFHFDIAGKEPRTPATPTTRMLPVFEQTSNLSHFQQILSKFPVLSD